VIEKGDDQQRGGVSGATIEKGAEPYNDDTRRTERGSFDGWRAKRGTKNAQVKVRTTQELPETQVGM
jgi:hypothetical protein